MQPAWIRHERGFRAQSAGTLFCTALLGGTTLSLMSATPALSASLATAYMSGVAPIAIAIGALGFGVAASALVWKWRADARSASSRAISQLSTLRSELDGVQAILEGMPEITLCWREDGGAPQVFGPIETVLTPNHRIADVLDYAQWLDVISTDHLLFHVGRLRGQGISFECGLTTHDARHLHVTGRSVGGAAIVRIQPHMDAQTTVAAPTDHQNKTADTVTAQTILSLMDRPAWVRDQNGRLIYTNDAYSDLAAERQVRPGPLGIAELFDQETQKAHMSALRDASSAVSLPADLTSISEYDVVLLPLEDGMAGYLRTTPEPVVVEQLPIPAELGQIGGVINALHTPIAIFNAHRELVHANSAYCDLWEVPSDWLTKGLREQAILDRLRTDGNLPAEIDYRAWCTDHLQSYGLKQTRETPWYLPDGRSLNTISVPLTKGGGVIYVFEDITEKLALESRYNALIQVQSETLNALSEAVAVFGTNGRLTLHNPRLSTVWKIPLNEMGKHPHIDQIGKFCCENLPEDGAHIWRDLKLSIVDLNPARTDKSGRINRSDGRLIDYAAVKLPDGQTLITFVDVTEGASYQKVLKERNDALITADRLKDAFVQNVSYELRSPLTNIIGFADILASGSAGPLNEKQTSYTDYIRTSSATLGVLIDNILDLATVDAGIAELTFEQVDVVELVEKASAGLKATFSPSGSEAPLNLVVEIAKDLPLFVADGTRIVQILYNLLSNAARFSDPGAEVRLTITARGNERIQFTVEDEGVGISDEMRAAIFQRFEGQSSQGRPRGAGLGLAIVRTFVNLHGGTIALEPRKPKGTRVIVNLPAQAAEVTSAAE